MSIEEPVTTIMTQNVITVQIRGSLKETERIMKKNHIRHLPVVRGEKLVGIVSLTDLQRLSFASTFGDEEESVDTAIYKMLNVGQVMVAKPRTVQSHQAIREVAEIFVEEGFHALPVLEGEKLVGIVTTTDVIRYLLQQGSTR